MKVLLVQPARWNSPLSSAMVIEPLGLEMVGAHLADHHDVKLVDMRWAEDPREALAKTLETYRPDVVGATVITSEVMTAGNLMAQVKEFDPSIVTVMGGPQPILSPETLIGHNCDVAVTMEGEMAFRDLVQALEQGDNLHSVPGLALYEDGQLRRTARRPLIADLGTLKLPKRSLTAEWRQNYFRGQWKPLAASFTTRGCNFRCNFCCTWLIGGAAYRTRGIKACLEDLASIQEDYVFMAEDDSMFDVEYSEQLADAIIASGIKKHYQFYSRSDLVVSRPDLFQKWKKAGLDLVLIGMEMADDGGLVSINKENNTDNNERAAKILKQIGIEVIAYFMVDPATFTADHFKRLTDYVITQQLTHPVFFIMTPLPGTAQYRERYDMVATDNLELFDFYHCVVESKLPLGEFYRRFIDLYKDCYGARPEGAKQSSAFSSSVVDALVTRLEQEYAPYMTLGSLRELRNEPRLSGQVMEEGKTLFPLTFKAGWSVPASTKRLRVRP